VPRLRKIYLRNLFSKLCSQIELYKDMVHPVLLFQMLDEAIITHNALSDRDKDWTKKEFKKIWEILSEYDGINPKKYRNEKLAAINAST
jgi:hypothetical protein